MPEAELDEPPPACGQHHDITMGPVGLEGMRAIPAGSAGVVLFARRCGSDKATAADPCFVVTGWTRESGTMDIMQAIYHRRSVRDYKPDSVPQDAIDAIIAAAIHAPSAMNLQPWAFVLIEGRQQLSRYAERAKRHLIETMSPDSPLSRYRDQLSDAAFDIFYGAPALIVVAATSDAAQSAEDCCMAAQNLLLAASGMGLGTCCIGFARLWLNLPDVKSELGIPDQYVCVVPIVVGYARSAVPRVPRKAAEVYRIDKVYNPSPQSEAPCPQTQPESRQFEEPAVTETNEDPGTDVAPARYDTPLDPSAPTRTPSPETCGPPDEDRS